MQAVPALLAGTSLQSSPSPAADKVTGRITTVAKMLDVSPSTIRRWVSEDPEFPRPFRLAENGDRFWLVCEVLDYVARRAGRSHAG
jgi:predicted DNA-binding transcriptional regulator AlpA